MNTLPLIALLLSSTICLTLLCNTKCNTIKELKIGDKAPEFLLLDKDGIQHSLAEWHGKKIALYFYPKDNTSGCTQQACSIRDNFNDLTENNIVIIGLSKGSKKSKTQFADKNHLPFPLLFATDEVLKNYNVNGGLFRLFIPKRRTFLINEKGIIVAIIKNVDTKNHAQQILNEFNNK